MADSNLRDEIQFWVVLILIMLCATFRAGRDGLSVLSAGAIGPID